MNEKKRIALLILILAVTSLAVTSVTIIILYRITIQEQREVLMATAQSQARLIESMAKFDSDFIHDPTGGSEHTTLEQVIEAHKRYKGIGETGEFTLAKREHDDIVFLLSHRYYDFDTPKPVPLNSELAEPMRRALSGLSGTMIGLDYRGETVLAAYEPVVGPGWGIVAKVDLSEIRAPYVKAGSVALIIASGLVVCGASLFFWITNPIMVRLREHSQNLARLVGSLQKSETELQKAKENLETRVEERTAELAAANSRLEIEVHERARAEERLQALWKIAEMVNEDDKELCDQVLQGALQMTQSEYAFYGFMNPEETVMSIFSWSKEALEDCGMAEHPIEFPIENAGIWAEAVRRKKVLVVNDYEEEHQGKIGLPIGHVPLTRILTVPVMNGNRVVAVVTAANKASDYTFEDVKQLEAFASGVQVIIDHRRTESSLRDSERVCRLLSQQVLEAGEKERKRFSREIHDGIGQSLAAIKFRIESLTLPTAKSTGSGSEELGPIIPMIQNTIDEVYKIQNDLSPAGLDELGIIATMSGFCEEFRSIYSYIDATIRINISEDDVPEYLRAPVFRILQEAMNNISKHSKASRAEIRFLKQDNMIEFGIEDNGVGFRISEVRSADSTHNGLGLFSMRERAELSGGTFELKSAPGEGTAIRVSWAV